MTLRELYKNAINDKFAICAFNFCNIEILKSIIEASEMTKLPVIACVSEGAMKYMGEFLPNIIKTIKKNHNNIFIHLDHGKSLDVVKKAINMGFDSVMIDGSRLSFVENVKLTKSVCEHAHKFDVLVEGEMGVLKGNEENIRSRIHKFSDPIECEQFVQETGVDSLAIAIGTSHGAHKFKGGPRLNFQLLRQIEERLPNFPLVLHGASSVSSEDVELFNYYCGRLVGAKGVSPILLNKIAKKTNIVKINTDTDIRLVFLGNLKKSMALEKASIDMRKHLIYATDKVTEKLIQKIMILR